MVVALGPFLTYWLNGIYSYKKECVYITGWTTYLLLQQYPRDFAIGS